MMKLLIALLLGLGITWAQSVTELNPADINLADGEASSKADWIRMRLVSVNGQTGDYILASGHGPQEGFIGEINDLINEELGPIFTSMGVSECEDIPTTGSGSAELDDDGEAYTVTATFAAGIKTIPSFYASPGTTLAKRIVLSEDGEDYLLVELNCEENDLITMYVLMPETDDNTRAREVYYQTVPSTGETRVDVHMTNSSDSERFVSRFHFDDGIARIWTIRTLAATGSGEAAVIDTETGLANTRFHIGAVPNTNQTTFSALGPDYCLDLTINDDGADCTGLTVNDPNDTPSVGGTVHSYTMDSVRTMTLGDI